MSLHIDTEDLCFPDNPSKPGEVHPGFEKLDIEAPRRGRFLEGGRLSLSPESLRALSAELFRRIAFFLPESELKAFRDIALDAEAGKGERFVAASLLKNAVIAAEGILPLCQDTGTATVLAFRGEDVKTGADDAECLAEGARDAYTKHCLRASQLVPVSMRDEAVTADNMPAQVEVMASKDAGYRFLFVAKGGGSSNKTSYRAETPALLSGTKLKDLLASEVKKLGTSACPPYRLAAVIGGSSPEYNMKIVKLASAGFLDSLPRLGPGEKVPAGDASPILAFRDAEHEEWMREVARESGLGAQFGGKHLAMSATVIRLPRHAASCFVSVGLSCNAHRGARAFADESGFYAEKLVTDPSRFFTKEIADIAAGSLSGGSAKHVDTDGGIEETRKALAGLKPLDMVTISGHLVLARDRAHAKIKELMDRGEGLPEWFKKYPVYYAGPARAPEGKPIGSLGPTTAGRMDAYLESFMAAGGSLVTLAKGNRFDSLPGLCARFGGTYLGTIGGAAALLAERVISSEILAWPELGMEAARLIEVKDLPAFVLVNGIG